jgi:SOS-response transcriptional repressor LexA
MYIPYECNLHVFYVFASGFVGNFQQITSLVIELLKQSGFTCFVKHFGKYVKAARERNMWTQDDLGARAGISTSAVAKIEADPIPHMRGTTYRGLAKAFGMSTDQLDAAWRDMHAPSAHADARKGIPIINKTSAGQARDYQDVGKGNYDFLPLFADSLGDSSAFAAIVCGDSMLPEWQNGDIIVCSPLAVPVDGEPCFVQFTGEGDDGNTFKRVFTAENDMVRLQSDNPRYAPKMVPRAQIIRCVPVVGKYVKYNRSNK